jgi:hypothetical protein
MLRTKNTQSTATGSELITLSAGNALTQDQTNALNNFFQIDNAFGHSKRLLDLFQSYLQSTYDDEGHSSLDSDEIIDSYFTVNQVVTLIKALQ